MTLVKYRPRRHLSPFNDLFSEFFNTDIGQLLGANDVQQFAPKVNIKEREKDFLLEMLVPGLSKKDMNIEVEDNTLKVSATVQNEQLEEKERYTRKEYTMSSFSRSFTLPEGTETDKIKAEFKNGTLKLTVPRVPEPDKIMRKISIS